jgi:hypothetical protein
MKCFTVTENGVVTGISFVREPYPHIPVGDPQLSSADYRRVEIDAALADSARDGVITACSYVLDAKPGADHRRVSYKIIASGNDDDMALVKLEAHCAAPGQRTFYEFPRDTMTLANGWYLWDRGPQVRTPVNLVVLGKNGEVRIYRTVDIRKPPELVFIVQFDGTRLIQKDGQRAAA